MLHNPHTSKEAYEMAKSLQQLRKDAGYRTAREFAEACGFTPSSLARYEKEPDAIPVKSAWKMADVLGCTIDDVVGRESQITADLRGEIQARYEALPASLRPSLTDYLGFLEMRADEAESVYRKEIEDCYTDMFKVYLVMFLESLSQEEKNDVLLFGSSDLTREKFQHFLYTKVIEKSSCIPQGGEVIQGVMRAYDRFYTTPRPSADPD